MKAIIGLGNPGKKYYHTRHNVGRLMIDYIYEHWLKDLDFSNWTINKKFQAGICEGQVDGQKIVLIKPLTMMNNSGQAVQALMAYYKIAPQDLLVIHDEVDLPFGEYKIQSNISSAGHNGIKSIIQMIDSQDFTRIRIGIAKANKQKQGETSNFVLNNFSFMEKLKLKEVKKKILEVIQDEL